jgi:hypothetical protein
MKFETERILDAAKTLPVDETSVSSAEREFESELEAERFFQVLKRRFLDLREWNKNAALSSFESYDEHGRRWDDTRIVDGIFLRIDLAGTGKPDWVRIERVQDSPDEVIISAKPTYDPTESPQETGKVSHFFTAAARNNFCIYRDKSKIHIYVIGTHETTNTGHTSGVVETVRNAAVANLGSYLGVQKAEWTKFCESFLSEATAARQ